MSSRRLPTGGRINRDATLPFTWAGKKLHGYAGDTLASALLANDVQLVGRSFKYHRPRGIMSAGVEESGALVTIGDGARHDANVKATTCELFFNLTAAPQNAFPNIHYDIGALANAFNRFLPAGFYYKTFMGPNFKWNGTKFWMQCEKIIRRAAGMGEASRLPDPDDYEHAHAFCDVLIVGGGSAGLTAAITAARGGLDVLLVEQEPEVGGDLLNQPATDDKLASLLSDARAAGVQMMTRTTAFGLYDGGVAALVERVTDHLPLTESMNSFQPRQRLWTVRARHTVIAAGAIERTIAFGNNDRPGVMTANAARSYLNRFGVLPGTRVVIATNNDSAYPTAVELKNAGAEVCLLDARREVADMVQQSAVVHDIALHFAHAPMKVHGGKKVSALAVASDDGGEWRYKTQMPCDLVLLSGGWSPTIHLHCHRGVRPVWDAQNACFLAGQCDEPLTVIGSAAGIWNEKDCEVSGVAAGQIALNNLAEKSTRVTVPAAGGWQTPIRPLYEVKVAGVSEKLKSFIDPQHDVTATDVRLAQREGYVSVEHLKRYTTLGMATDGGKVGNVIGLALMADALGRDIPQVGSTGFRPPFTPVALGALRGRSVGEHFRPLRRTPMHHWNLKHGAVMTMAGLWHRPYYFPRDKNDTLSDAYIRETTCVRDTVGLCDVTSLGKIAVQGPDATEFLNRIYTNPFAKLAIGRARYGIMLRDDGVVMDDGTTWRLSPTDYFMTTTTAHAGKVMAWLEELLQTRWQDLRVEVTSVTDQWAGCAVAGPNSRVVLDACVDDAAAVGDDALPFMGVIEINLRGIPCRIARISFSGEMAYEVYTPSDYAVAMMEMLWSAGEALGGCLYGLEALGALRIEKGHVTGAELDGRVTIDDAGLGAMASTKKTFVGDALRKRPEFLREDRAQLVGVIPKNRAEKFNAGAILCAADDGERSGWITGVTHSPALGHWIGIGFIAGGQSAWRERAAIAADPVRNASTQVEIISPHIFDADGGRMRG